MICGMCMRRFDNVSLTEYGLLCVHCLPGIQEREEKLYMELLAEEATMMPSFLDVDAFERFMLKFSLHYLVKLGGEHIEHIRTRNPILLRPRMMALHLKELVTNAMPLYYVSAMDAEGRDRLFHRGTYEFKKAVPSEIVMDALKQADLIKTMEGESDAF